MEKATLKRASPMQMNVPRGWTVPFRLLSSVTKIPLRNDLPVKHVTKSAIRWKHPPGIPISLDSPRSPFKKRSILSLAVFAKKPITLLTSRLRMAHMNQNIYIPQPSAKQSRYRFRPNPENKCSSSSQDLRHFKLTNNNVQCSAWQTG